MPRRAVSRDLKARIPYLAYVEGFKVKEIGRILGVKKSIVPNPQLLQDVQLIFLIYRLQHLRSNCTRLVPCQGQYCFDE